LISTPFNGTEMASCADLPLSYSHWLTGYRCGGSVVLSRWTGGIKHVFCASCTVHCSVWCECGLGEVVVGCCFVTNKTRAWNSDVWRRFSVVCRCSTYEGKSRSVCVL